MVRDEEFKRLIKYAQGLGIKVETKPYVPYSKVAAVWHLDGSTIEIYTNTNKSKTDFILDILHEIAHHLYWVDLGKVIPIEVDLAIIVENARKNSDVIDKKYRKQIYLFERNSSYYHEYIYKAVGLTFPIYKLYAERDLSNWIYYRYYLTGKYPIRKATKKKEKQIRKRYRNESAS